MDDRTARAPAEADGPTLLIDALDSGRLTRGEVERIQVIETEGSCIVVAGGAAYKMKKPALSSSAAARRQACQHELELGRRLAPALYRRIVKVRGSVEHPCFDGSGPLLDAAIEMHAFHPSRRFDRIAGRGELCAADVDRLAASLARFHREAARAPAGDPRASERRLRALVEYLIHKHGAAGNADLVEWCDRELARCAEVLAVRARDGWCRTVHGDMRLAHAARLDHAIAFFGPRIPDGGDQHDDVAADVSALAADLEAAGHRPLAWRLLNRWSMELADPSAPAVLPLYLVVRHLTVAGAADAARAALRLELARAATHPDPPVLVVMHGVTGTGKSTVATDLAARLAGFLVRSDAVRKALLGLAPQARTGSSLGAGAYAGARTEDTYRALGAVAERGLDAGRSVVADACFLAGWQRKLLIEVAARRKMPAVILDVDADPDFIEARVRARLLRGDDPSEADLAVLEQQRRTLEPLCPDERARAVTVSTNTPVDTEVLVRRIRRLASR